MSNILTPLVLYSWSYIHDTCYDPSLTSTCGWCSPWPTVVTDVVVDGVRTFDYIQIDLGHPWLVVSSITAARANYPQWLTMYSVVALVIPPGSTWVSTGYHIRGNTDESSLKTYVFGTPFLARYVRLLTYSIHGWPSTRWSLELADTAVICTKGSYADFQSGTCKPTPAGYQTSIDGAANGRLKINPEYAYNHVYPGCSDPNLFSSIGWCADPAANYNPFITTWFNLPVPTQIIGMVIAGRADKDEWLYEFTLSYYSNDWVVRSTSLLGNSGRGWKIIMFDTSIVGLSFYVDAVSWILWNSVRWSVIIADTPYTICPIGTYSLAGASSCITCTSGTFAQSAGSTQCSTCASGWVSVDGSGTCTKCLAGTYANGNVCSNCPFGTISASDAAVSCANCLAGTFSLEGKTTCSTCTAGYISAGNRASSCTICKAGTYSGGNQWTVCNLCADGWIASSDGLSGCTQCLAGSYALTRSSCPSCNAGQYTDTAGLLACKDCWPGTVSVSSGKSTCTNCNAGSYLSLIHI